MWPLLLKPMTDWRHCLRPRPRPSGWLGFSCLDHGLRVKTHRGRHHRRLRAADIANYAIALLVSLGPAKPHTS